MLKNAYLDAKIGVDPAENEPPKERCVVADGANAEFLGRAGCRARCKAGYAVWVRLAQCCTINRAWQKHRAFLVVLGWIGADFRVQIRIF